MRKRDLDQGLVYSNVEINPNKAYVLYVGDVKYIDTTVFLTESLSKRYGKPVEVINILPDIPPNHTDRNYMVINSGLTEYVSKNDKDRFVFPMDQADINKEVSDSRYVKEVIHHILRYQKDIFINVFKSTPEMNLADGEGIQVIGPNPVLFSDFDNKIYQRKLAEDLGIPVPKGYVANSFEELLQLYQNNFKNDAFVASSNSFGGNGVQKISSLDDILNSKKLEGKQQFIISELLDIISSPSSQGIVSGEETLVVTVTDQIMDGVSYKGALFPSKEGKDMIIDMEKYSRMIGEFLGGKGYRGFFGIDFMTDINGNLYFTEINPRKTGHAPEIMWAHRISNPKSPSLAELELRAVTKGDFGSYDVGSYKMPDINWGVYSLKAKKGQRTLNCFDIDSESSIFNNSGLGILDHPGANVGYILDGRFARVVSVNKNRKKVLSGLNDCESLLKVA